MDNSTENFQEIIGTAQEEELVVSCVTGFWEGQLELLRCNINSAEITQDQFGTEVRRIKKIIQPFQDWEQEM